MRILMAVDAVDLRLALELMLSEEPGVDVVGSVSEVAGLWALLETACPDLVLLDLTLLKSPLEDWFLQIREMTCEPYPRVVLLGPGLEDREPALEAGADDFVLIGDPPENLLAALQAFLEAPVSKAGETGPLQASPDENQIAVGVKIEEERHE